MSKGNKGAFGGKLRGKDGKTYDTANNTIDGALPIEVGDCFYYRAKSNPSAQVHLVKCRRIVGRIALLSMYNAAGQPEASMFVELSKIDVVQQAAPIPDPDDHEERILLRPAHVAAAFQDPLPEPHDLKITDFPLYAEDIALAKHVVYLDVAREILVILKSETEPTGPTFFRDDHPAIADCAEPILKPEPFPPSSPAGS